MLLWQRVLRRDAFRPVESSLRSCSRRGSPLKHFYPLMWKLDSISTSFPSPIDSSSAIDGRQGHFRLNRSCMSDSFYSSRTWRHFSSQGWVEPPAGTVVDVPLAQTGEGIAECELLKWFVQEGEIVEEFQRLCEVQSDKATIEITSRYKGKIHQILFTTGDVVKVGETLLKILVEEDNEAVTAQAPNVDDQDSEASEKMTRGILSTPAVRQLAKKYDLDIYKIKGTGLNGRILKEDVINHAITCGVALESTEEEKTIHESSEGDKSIHLTGFQRAMVRSMMLAARIPHFHYVEEINFDGLAKLKEAFQEENTDPEVKYTYLPFLVKSLSMALARHPILNSSFVEESNELILKGSHNIGVAVATPHGLAVPNIKNVQSLSIHEIARELIRLQQLATKNKLNSDDIAGGTLTLTNIGSIGGIFGNPLINSPEVAIIALGRIRKLPRFKSDGSLHSAAVGNIVIGADHRVVDGATVARFCNDWKALVEKPESLLLRLR